MHFLELLYIIGNFYMHVLFIQFYELFISVKKQDCGAAPLRIHEYLVTSLNKRLSLIVSPVVECRYTTDRVVVKVMTEGRTDLFAFAPAPSCPLQVKIDLLSYKSHRGLSVALHEILIAQLFKGTICLSAVATVSQYRLNTRVSRTMLCLVF